MMSVEIRVNGSIVGALCAVRCEKGYVDTYEYQIASFPMNNKGPVITQNGKLTHATTDGIEMLAAKLCIEAARAVGHSVTLVHGQFVMEDDNADDHGSTEKIAGEAHE
jgi:hypothetical protein